MKNGKIVTLEQTVTSPDAKRSAEKATEKKVLLIERVEIQGPEHKMPIPTRATKLGWKGGYALFYDGYHDETRLNANIPSSL